MEKIFYQDTHIVDFEARVLDCAEEPDGRYRITLDKTAFFPEEGGQGADSGTLGGQEVLDVQIKADIIYHYIKEPLQIGSTVKGHVDWAQRFDYIQQHSGELLCPSCGSHRTNRYFEGYRTAEPQRRYPYQYSLRRKSLTGVHHAPGQCDIYLQSSVRQAKCCG